MRACALGVALLLVASHATADSLAAGASVYIEAADLSSLQVSLLRVAQERLEAARLFVDPERAWLTVSGHMPEADGFEVRTNWSVQPGMLPAQPLIFEIRPVHAGVAGSPMRASLAVRLLRDQWVAARRLAKGSPVSCDDLKLMRRHVSQIDDVLTAQPCELARDGVAQRDLTSGEVIRRADIGAAREVVAQSSVEVSVRAPGIELTTVGIALADASQGEEVPVRLQHPTRILKVRVTGAGMAELTGVSP